MTLQIVADENLLCTPLLAALDARVQTMPGRQIDTAAVRDADVLLVRSVTRVDAKLLRGSAVRFVGTATAGTDHINAADLEALGVPFASAPGTNAIAVTEYVLTALAYTGRLVELMTAGGSVGIVGFGHVGKRLAATLLGLGVGVRVWDPWVDVPAAIRGSTLDSVLECTVLSLHAALHDVAPWPSRAMLTAEALRAAPDGQLLINAGRGELATRDALTRVIDRGGALVLDTWPDEPCIDAGLLGMTTIATPHIAGYSYQAKARATDVLVDKLCDHLGLTPPLYNNGEVPSEVMPSSAHGTPAHWVAGLLADQYRIADDDLRLRATATPDVSGAAFDGLRRDYALRRELAGRTTRIDRSNGTLLRPYADALGLELELC